MLTDTEKSFSDILTVDENGISFKDGEKVSFNECAANFKNAYSLNQSKCVAERDITANPPYFAFYTNNKLRLVFDCCGLFSKSRNKKRFTDLQLKIQKTGFTTYDLS